MIRHAFSSVEDAATWLVVVVAAIGVIWRMLHLAGKAVGYLARMADLPETVAAHTVQLGDHEQRLVTLETTTRTVETVETRRTVEPMPAPSG